MNKKALWVMAAFLIVSTVVFTACGGSGGVGGSAPYIYAEINSFPTGSAPLNFQSASVYVVDDSSGYPITDASVTVNGITLSYNATTQQFEGNPIIVSGASVNLVVSANGHSYTATGTQFTSYPNISQPTTGDIWHVGYAGYVAWSAGIPMTSEDFYGLGVLDTGPTGQLIWPQTGYLESVPQGTTSYTIPTNGIAVGNYIVIVGIAKSMPIAYATSDSIFVISGFNYAPITFENAMLTSLTVTPDNPSIIKGLTQQFTATGTFSDSTTQDLTTQVSWSAWSTTFVTINNIGLATGLTTGSTIVIAALGSVSDSTPVTVMPTMLDFVTVTPAHSSIGNGATQQFSATGTFVDQSTRDVTKQVTWTSSDNSKMTVDNQGLATCISSGTATISATLWGISNNAPVKLVPGFVSPKKYSDASNSIWLGNTAIGDLNGDGRNDVAVLESSGSRILIYYQNNQGTLDPPTIITTDLKLSGIAIADVNNDGLSELIVSGNSTSATSGLLGRIAIFSQDPTSHVLIAPQEYSLSTNNAGPLAVADLNGDGLLDVITAGTGSGTNGVISIFYQNGSGVLSSEVTYTSVSVVVDGELHVADMNNDGLKDIVVQSGPTQIAVIKQLSPGTFSLIPDYYTVQASYFRSFALGDINGDGLTDIVAVDSMISGNLNIFLQNGSGTLTGPTIQNSSSFYGANEVHIADLDGDGLNDIIVLCGGSAVRILYQDSDHSFPSLSTYHLPQTITGGSNIHQMLSIGDVTGDSLSDIVSAWTIEGIYVLQRNP